MRVYDGRHRPDRTDQPEPQTIAFIVRVHDRLGNASGWKLKPLVVMLGPKSRIWPTVAELLASTQLMTIRKAKAAVKQANADATASSAVRP